MKAKIIKMGAMGADIQDIQKLLQKTGSSIKVTGVFGIGMYSAVKAFQRKNGLKETGEIDTATLKKLNTFKTSKRK